MKLGFIGVGNMGYAMLKALCENSNFETFFYEVNKERVEFLNRELNSNELSSICELTEKTDVIILAVKPYQYEIVAKDILKNLRKNHILISVAPSIILENLYAMFNGFNRIIRSMPNTPALVSCGITGVVYDDNNFTEEEIENIFQIFKSFGEVERVSEEQLFAVTAIAGSLPAYVDIFIETLADAGVKYGLTRDVAYKFASKAVEGSAKLVYETKEHPAVLKDRVCSPSGTTIVAVEALERNGFRNAIWQACNSCYDKAKNNK